MADEGRVNDGGWECPLGHSHQPCMVEFMSFLHGAHDHEANHQFTREELLEIEEAVAEGSADHIAEEVGDLLFAAAQLARKAGVDAEESLRLANLKFAGRFQAMEAAAAADGSRLQGEDMARLEARWVVAKG